MNEAFMHGERTISVDGKDLKIQVMPNFGGVTISFPHGTDGLVISGEYTDEKAIAAIEGYRWGMSHGKNIGRSVFQNELRNLLDMNR